MNSILKTAFVNSGATALYIVLLVSAIFYAPKFVPEPGFTILIPIGMLLLFVFSAALTGLLVLGRPILWYLDGKKKEVISLLIHTLAILFGFLLVAFILTIVLPSSSEQAVEM